MSSTSIAEDVIGRKGRFGRFAANWLSRKTLGLPGFGTMERDDVPDIPLSYMKDMGPPAAPSTDGPSDEGSVQEKDESCALPPPGGSAVESIPKLLRYTKLLFSSQNFFFAYDFDLSRSVSASDSRRNHLPLYKMADPLVCFLY